MDLLRDSWAGPPLGGRYVVVDRQLPASAVRELLDLMDLVDTPGRIREVVVDGRVLVNSRRPGTYRTVDRPRRPVLQVRTARTPPPRYTPKPLRQRLHAPKHRAHALVIVDLPTTGVGTIWGRRC